jgi:porin
MRRPAWGSGILLAGFLLPLGSALTAQERGREVGRGLNQAPGVQVEVGYAADLFKPVRGGLSQGFVAQDNLDLLLHLSLNPLLGLRGTSIRVHVQSNRGESVSSEVGALQGIGNLEAPREWRVYEAWIAHQFGSPRISFLAGIYDINAEFDVIPGAGDFLNSSFGFGPEYDGGGMGGPSTYPTTALAARFRFEPSPTLYGLVGVSDGLPGDRGAGRFTLNHGEGALLSVELGYAEPFQDFSQVSSFTPPEGRMGRRAAGRPMLRGQRRQIGRGRRTADVSTKIALGGWAFTKRMDCWDPEGPRCRSWGLYLLGEQQFFREPDGVSGISGFARVGTATDGVNRLDLSVEGSLLYRGAVPGRPDDAAGAGFAYARNGSPFLEAQERDGKPLERAETVLELTYRAELGRYFVLQPDLQWIVNPGMDPALDDALIFGLRAYVLLEYPGSEGDS